MKSRKLLSWKEVEWAYSKWCEGYTQLQIATALDVSSRTIQRCLSGRQRIRPVLTNTDKNEMDCTGCTVLSRAKLLNKFQWREFKGEMPQGYDWVLVCDAKGNLPYIAEYSKTTGKWHRQDALNSELEDLWYKVKYWKPIYDEAVPCCGLSELEWEQIREEERNENIG